MSLYPLQFHPALKAYLWGGRNLASKLGRTLPPGEKIAESWDIAAHPDGESIVANGVYAGLSLTALHEQLGLALIGSHNAWAQARHKFPLLVKLLDAQERLSVQVHPDDAYAAQHAGAELGKTEMWVILDAAPEAAVILGVQPGVTRATFEAALAAGRLESQLHVLPVQAGDFVCVPAGSLHAILGGLLIAEIQQNSNTTYRVYDWNRRGADGRSRPLHLESALEVINFTQVAPPLPRPQSRPAPAGQRREVLCRNRYFTVERLELPAGAQWDGVCDGRSLEIWGVLSGRASLVSQGGRVNAPAVTFTLLPAALGPFQVQAESNTQLLRTYVEA